ncbi:MAG: YraN family protein [Eubacteriales bacterium]|nr:YraN family protein [Eubacteriales bacterium]
MNKRTVGAYYESCAAELLRRKGYAILARNYRCRTGEIDLIARDYGSDASCPVLVFVEVKYRKHRGSGYPEEAVSYPKQKVICRTSDFFRMEKRIGDNVPIRFDVIAFDGNDVRHITDAFPYTGYC